MKPKINIDRDKITPEEIREKKDFNAVLKQYQLNPKQGVEGGKSFFRSTGFLATGAVILAATVSVFIYNLNSKSSEKNAPINKQIVSSEQVKMKVNPPVQKLDIAYQHYQVDAVQGGEFKTTKGSRITVPQKAFADASGKELNGQVELRFREFHDPVDFFLCGIPMCYDSAGVRYQFESAGMVELLGFKDGKPVYILPGKQVQIELNSKRTGGVSYNVYKFDTASCNWEYMGKDKTAGNETLVSAAGPVFADSLNTMDVFNALPEVKALDIQMQQAKNDCEKQLKQLSKPVAEPQKPIRATAGLQHLKIDILPSEFPEMAQYKSMLFEEDPDNTSVDKDVFNKDWEDIKLSAGTKKGVNYTLTLMRNKQTVHLIVRPVFEGKEYDKALADFNVKFKKYEADRAQRVKIQEEEDTKIAACLKKRKEVEEQHQQQLFNSHKMEALVSSFSISGFGIYNCDSPCLYPKGQISPVRLVDAKGQLLPCTAAYLVDDSKNALFTYYSADIPEFRFNPKAKNLLWTFANNKFYVLRNDQFHSIGVSGHHDMKLEEVEQEFKSAEEMRAYLGI
jgi:hypothetical protein